MRDRSSRPRIVHGVHGGDPRATRSDPHESGGAARVGRRCGPRGRSGYGRSCSGALGGDELPPQRWAFQLDPMGAVNDAVEDRVAERGVGDHLVPFADRHLAGDQQRSAVIAVVDDLEQIAAMLGIERLRAPIIDDQQPDAFERGQQPRQATFAARLGQRRTGGWRACRAPRSPHGRPCGQERKPTMTCRCRSGR
jgi:hypothetical protein